MLYPPALELDRELEFSREQFEFEKERYTEESRVEKNRYAQEIRFRNKSIAEEKRRYKDSQRSEALRLQLERDAFKLQKKLGIYHEPELIEHDPDNEENE